MSFVFFVYYGPPPHLFKSFFFLFTAFLKSHYLIIVSYVFIPLWWAYVLSMCLICSQNSIGSNESAGS